MTTPAGKSDSASPAAVGGSVRIRINAYRVIDEAVELGLGFAWNRLVERFETLPDVQGEEATLALDAMHHEIMLALCDVLIFDDPPEEP